jgi:hypothetical protein
MLMNYRGGPSFWGCMLMNYRGGPPILREEPPLGTISMDHTVCTTEIQKKRSLAARLTDLWPLTLQKQNGRGRLNFIATPA